MDALATLTKELGLPLAEAEGLALVLRDPPAYVERFRQRLASRSVDAPCEGLATIALSDALEAAGKGVILDWKFELADATHQIDGVLGADAERWIQFAASDEDEPNEVLEELADHLRQLGQTMMLVGIDGDCYEFFLVPNTVAPRVIELCAQLGFDVGAG